MQSSRSGCSSTNTSPSHGIGTSSRHARLLRQFNEDIFKRHVLTDVEVVVGGQVFQSHRAVLVCFSPSLKRKLLTSDGKPIARRVCISRISSEEFEILLHYMYTGDLNVTCNNFYEIFKAASVLEMRDVIQECLQILDRPDDIRTYFYIYVTSKKMDAQRSWLRALRLLTHRFEESVCESEFLQVDLHCVMELLSAQSIGARSEVVVFLAALNWLDHDYQRRQEHALKVMGCVRFSCMTMDEIVACYHPPFLPQLLEIPEIVTMLFKATCFITAKFLGQESWFRHFGCPKRNLDFEDLPIELWHKKDPLKNSSTDFAVNWQNSVKSEICGDNQNSLDSKTDVSSLPYSYKPHYQSTNPTDNSRSFQHIKNGSEDPPKNLSVLCQRGDSAEAVRKILEQSALASRDEINVARVVKRVLGEINTRRDQREEPEGNRYRLHRRIKEKNEEQEEQSSGRSRFERSSHYLHNSSEPRTSNTNRHDQDGHFRKSPHLPANGKLKQSQMSHNHDHTSPAEMVARANLPCLSKGNHGNTSPTKEERAKHDKKESSKESVGNEKGNEPVFLTAVKEEPRLLKDQPEVTNFHLKYDPPQMKAKAADLEERPPRQAFIIPKSSSVDIHEVENPSSNVNVSLESSLHTSKSDTAAILVTGGMDPNNLHKIGIGGDILNYDPKKDKWTRYGTLPSPRHNHSAVVWDNCLYIIGGCNPLETLQQKRYVAQRTCHKLDLATSHWSVLRDMKFRRYDHGSVVVDGHIYVIGGQDTGERLLKTVEVYDTESGKWRVLPSEMCCGRKAVGTAVLEGKIWIAGGLMQADKEITQQVVSHVDCYDLTQKRWTFHLESLPTPRCYCSLSVWNDRIYCIGGLRLESKEKMRPAKEVWIFDHKTQVWEEGPPLPAPRMSCGTLVYDGLLYAIGGFDPESDVAIRNMNHLSPAATCWEEGAPLPSHLFGIAAVSVPRMD